MEDRSKLSRRSFLLMATVTGTGLLVAACTPKATPAPTAAPTKPAAAAATAVPATAVPAPTGPVDLRYVSMASVDTENPILDKFREANPTISVEYEYVSYNDYQAKIATEIAGGVPPDVGGVGDHAYDLVMRGAYKNLDPFIEADNTFDVDDFFAASIMDGTYNGRYCSGGGPVHALPYGLVVWGFYYNAGMLRDAGFAKSPNDLWDEGAWNYDSFREKGIYRLDLPEPHVAFKGEIEDPANNPFPTPSGKIEIFSQEIADWNHPMIPPVPKYIETWEGRNDPLAEKYPLQLITSHFKTRAHTQFHNVPWLRELETQAVLINSVDAQARGIKDGDRVVAFNDRGKTLITARVTEGIMPGVVDIPEGAWYDPDEKGVDRGGCCNVLTRDEMSPGGAFCTNTALVEVQKFEER